MNNIYDQIGEACKQFGERVGASLKEANDLMATNGRRERDMNLADEIRKQIEKNRGLKLAVGEINNHLSTLENLVRKDIMEQVDEAYQRGLEEGKKAFDLLESERNSEYQRGLDDAWECAKKLFSTMSETEIEKVFPTEWENGFYGLMQMKPQYAIETLKSYEKKSSRTRLRSGTS